MNGAVLTHSSGRDCGWGGASPGQLLLPGAPLRDQGSSLPVQRPREGKAPPGSDSDSITAGYPSSHRTLVLAPDQLLDTPPRTSGTLIHPPFPSPHPQLGGHITCHLSIQRPNPCHQRNPGSMVSLQTMLLWVQGGEDRVAPRLACPGSGPALQPRAAGLPSGQVLGAATGPAAGTLLLVAWLALNKQGCVATAAPCVGERETGDISPQPCFLQGLPGAGHSQVASLSCGAA